jgi:dihydroxy-acid dehydratase
VVFEDIEDLQRRIDDPALNVSGGSVLVLKNSGPKGGPGMPEWGQLPIPARLLKDGISDLVRISDARMSGTAFGTVILHVSPEAAVGGPLAIVEDGDLVVLDVERRRIDVELSDDEVRRRFERWSPPGPRYLRGYGALFLEHVLQADEGCDFAFLQDRRDEGESDLPYGLLHGWIGGW